MFGKIKILISVAVIFFIGCAKPQYVQKNTEEVAPQSAVLICDKTKKLNDLCISWQWLTKPTDEDYGKLIIKSWRKNMIDESIVPVDLPDTPEVYLWMPSMGHGSVPTTTSKADLGTYLVENVFFIMPGDWEIRVKLNQESIENDEVSFSYIY